MKTQDLIGPALDWAVQEAQLKTLSQPELGLLIPRIGYGRPAAATSTDWSQGGPIIEREVNVLEKKDGYFYAWRSKRINDRVTTDFKTIKGDREAWAYGPTPLVAAMRCYVASKLGDDVEIPEELR